MKEEPFRRWLEARYPAAVAATRLANVRRVEFALGDLDAAYRDDSLANVLSRLSLSKSEHTAGVSDRSGISFDGDAYNGLATLKSAAKLYREFRSANVREAA